MKENVTSPLAGLGYLGREARFLELVALHSGYFLRRQYREFLGTRPGRPEEVLFRRVLSLGHGNVVRFGPQIQVCHLSSRSVYAALGDDEDRHRRARPTLGIKVKLMALDYVLCHREAWFLGTAGEKLSFFCDRLRLDHSLLPGRRYGSRTQGNAADRVFVERFPIRIGEGERPEVAFSYIDEGSIVTPSFDTWLVSHNRLLAAIGRARVVFVSSRAGRFQKARERFTRFLGGTMKAKSGLRQSETTRMLRYLDLEARYRRGDLRSFTTGQLDELGRLRKAFSRLPVDRLLELRERSGEAAVGASFVPESAIRPPGDIAFETYLLPFDYSVLDVSLRDSSVDTGGPQA